MEEFNQEMNTSISFTSFLNTGQPEPPVQTIDGLLGLHRWAGGWDNPDGMPIVMPPFQWREVMMTEPIQWISYKMMKAMNSTITPKIWTRLHDNDRVHTNYKGFDRGNDDAYINYITGDGKQGILPAYDKPFRSGGGQFHRKGYKIELEFSIITMMRELYHLLLNPKSASRQKRLAAIAEPNVVVFTAGVDGIDANAIPTSFANETLMHDYTDVMAARAIENNWFVYGLSGHDASERVEHFTQGNGLPCIFPFIFTGTIRFYKQYFMEWSSLQKPDPLIVYRS